MKFCSINKSENRDSVLALHVKHSLDGRSLFLFLGYTILIWQRDDTLEEESKVKTKDRPYGFKSPDDSTSSGPSLHPKSRAKTKLRRSTNTKQLD